MFSAFRFSAGWEMCMSRPKSFLENLLDVKDLIQKHDFYYQRADDHRAWRKGIGEFMRIQRYKKLIGKKYLHKLWRKYAPTNVQLP